jgi:mRNA-degrading endonuclease toxin of MazEF toxin-antitoxin module
MIDAGDIFIADVGHEVPRHVLVLSNEGFHRRSNRVLVAPEWRSPGVPVPFPWIVEGGDDMEFAIDRMGSVEADRLLRRAGRAPYRTMWLARQALIAIT